MKDAIEFCTEFLRYKRLERSHYLWISIEEGMDPVDTMFGMKRWQIPW